ncbi:radical SAM protein [Hoeflea olei]|uniref:Radical SAM core domain-containing protein n=1 Tax=Hoeflea olei TaxID=1480615 RepID=A0A1C1YXM5_9HYPH|nr:radical SAM protein [Hoeflea olei]OCW58225.1 hypothetical protein AWJ14_01315 [Hoeflea olei]
MLERLSINLTHLCNLDCAYCYALGGDYGGYSGDARVAEVEARITDVALLNPNIKSVQFFGGEPLLRFDLVDGFTAHIDKLVHEGAIAAPPRYSVVTNLTLLDDARIEIMKRHDMSVVVSLDGPPEVNDATRPYKGGRVSTARVLENLAKLRDHGITFDIECTFSKLHWAKGYSALSTFLYIAELGPSLVKMTNVTHPDPEIGFNTREDIARVLDENLTLLDYALEALTEKGRLVPLGFLTELINALQARADATPQSGGCGGGGGSYCNAGTGNIAISADAKIYPCHMFTANRAFEMEIAGGAVTRQPKMASKRDHAACTSCWASSWCVACPGAMEFRRPGHSGPSAIHCGLMRGGLEHVFAALADQDASAPRLTVSG